jgi:CheY-like chemotaxis protein
MKLAHGKGKLTITTEKADNTIKVSVKDNGPGIKPEIMERIFDPFFTTREVGQGTGLGLSLCYGIVVEHNGRIHAESKPGKGATFIIELPVITEVLPLEPAKPAVKKPHKRIKDSILVVDDEAVVRDIAKRVLSADGHKVDIAGDALEGLSKINNKKYDLVLLDIKMPGMNGVEMYKKIQKTAKPFAGKIVFMTGDIMGADTEKFLTRTGAAHIEKPFDGEQLTRAITGALHASG